MRRFGWLWAGALGLAVLASAKVSQACGWDNESYAAEAQSLPCVFDAVFGTYPKHSQAFYLARIAAADALLEWSPAHLDALDMKGIALLKLGRFKEAEATMLRRAQLAPAAYASHANLGTLYTFTGDWVKALSEIDQALGIEPRAHFGREKYHRLLVLHLRDKASDPPLALRENFLGLKLTLEQRLAGSPEAFTKAGADPQLFDALVAMITVYGADKVPDIYLALGEALALHGERRLAWTAYQRAISLKHPRKQELRAWQAALVGMMHADYVKDPVAWAKQFPDVEGMSVPSGDALGQGDYGDIANAYWWMTHSEDPRFNVYKRKADEYTKWEAREIKKGLPVWREEGLTKLYAHANELRPRCQSPGVILGQPLPQAVP